MGRRDLRSPDKDTSGKTMIPNVYSKSQLYPVQNEPATHQNNVTSVYSKN